MQVIDTRPTLKRKFPRPYPQLVDRNEFGFFQKLTARMDMTNLGNSVFLGYCKIHKQYYVDHKHTNGEIRCPICDEKWLHEQGFTYTPL